MLELLASKPWYFTCSAIDGQAYVLPDCTKLLIPLLHRKCGQVWGFAALRACAELEAVTWLSLESRCSLGGHS